MIFDIAEVAPQFRSRTWPFVRAGWGRGGLEREHPSPETTRHPVATGCLRANGDECGRSDDDAAGPGAALSSTGFL